MGNEKDKRPNHAYFSIFQLTRSEHKAEPVSPLLSNTAAWFKVYTKPMTYIIIVTLWSDLSASLFLSSTSAGDN